MFSYYSLLRRLHHCFHRSAEGAYVAAFAGGEHGPRRSHTFPKPGDDWVRTSEHAPGGPFRRLERRHGLAEIVERGAVVFVWTRLETTRRATKNETVIET